MEQHDTSSLAIASLVLGAVGIITCVGGVLVGIPGVILGLVALSRIKKSEGTVGGRGIAIGGIVTSAFSMVMALLVVVIVLVSIPAFRARREDARRDACRDKLEAIGVKSFMYAADNGDKFPEKLSDLFPKHVGDMSIFVCETANEIITNADEIDARSSYIMVPGISSTANTAGTIFVYEKKGIHEGGSNVLFADGSIEWVDEERLKVLLSASAQAH